MDEATPGNWSNLQLFVAVAREGGLSSAARVTGRSAATLGRRMLALERQLGRELFIRHERGYELTVEGRSLLADLDQVEARIMRATAPLSIDPLPLVKISAGSWTTMALMDRITEIVGDPMDTRLRFVAADNILDIGHREVVIGIRNARPTEENLARRKLARLDFAGYATPNAPDRWVKVLAATPSAKWLDRTVGNDAVCEVTAPRNALDLALRGVGVALLPCFIGDTQPDLQRRGGIVSELAQDRWIVSHHDDRHLPEVRRIIDRLSRILDGTPRAQTTR